MLSAVPTLCLDVTSSQSNEVVGLPSYMGIILGLLPKMDIESVVKEIYTEGAQTVQPSLCCPVNYDPKLLSQLPQEIIEKDYGCGNPSEYVRTGDTVLDLGSGGGKICYMAAIIAGSEGKVIGVDMCDEMLALAKKYQGEMAQKIGADIVDFRKGYIQDLALNLDELEAYISTTPIVNMAGLQRLERYKAEQRAKRPLVESDSVDVVVSNCVLNLVAKDDRQKMISEIFRVLKPGGRVAISDIVSNAVVPEDLQNDPKLWTDCISGAFEAQEFLKAFLNAGFVFVKYDKLDKNPWKVVGGIEFRSATLTARKPPKESKGGLKASVCYVGPFQEVLDDFEDRYVRGRVFETEIAKADLFCASGEFAVVESEHAAKSCCPKSKCCKN